MNHSFRSRLLGGLAAAGIALGVALPLAAQEGPVYLPVVRNNPAVPAPTPKPPASPTPLPTPGAPVTAGRPSIYAHAIPEAGALDQATVFWFGAITPTSNSTDVRIGYTSSLIDIYLATFDRQLWYDTTPDPATFDQWDAATLYISAGDTAAAPRFRIRTQMYFDGNLANARMVERWTGSGWTAAPLAIETFSGWRGEKLNNVLDGRGWAQTFRVPFAALGLPNATTGARLRFALVVHDRDGSAGPVNPAQVWPEGMNPADMQTWSTLTLGEPAWTPPAGAPAGETIIRRLLKGDDTVADASVGGSPDNLCGDNSGQFWEVWPNLNFGAAPGANVQNQIDLADWPCYARYYVTFDLDTVPAGKVIQSATLTLHQWGNSGPKELAKRSYIQVARVDRAWQESTITWNNAPGVLETIGGSWVDVLMAQPAWPGVARQWNVSKAVADAYAAGEPVRLALYSADSGYHSGKLFVTSDSGDWNIAGRPTLRIVWGNP